MIDEATKSFETCWSLQDCENKAIKWMHDNVEEGYEDKQACIPSHIR